MSAALDYAGRERAIRQWFAAELGESDGDFVVAWLLERHGPSMGTIEILEGIRAETLRGGPKYLRTILAHARRPKVPLDYAQEIYEWTKMRLDRAADVIGVAHDPRVVKEQNDDVMRGLEAKLQRLFPAKHPDSLRRALTGSFKTVGGEVSLNVVDLAETLCRPEEPAP